MAPIIHLAWTYSETLILRCRSGNLTEQERQAITDIGHVWCGGDQRTTRRQQARHFANGRKNIDNVLDNICPENKIIGPIRLVNAFFYVSLDDLDGCF